MPATAGQQIAVSVRLIATCLSRAWASPAKEFEFSLGGSSEAVTHRMSVTAGYGAMRCAYYALRLAGEAALYQAPAGGEVRVAGRLSMTQCR